MRSKNCANPDSGPMQSWDQICQADVEKAGRREREHGHDELLRRPESKITRYRARYR